MCARRGYVCARVHTKPNRLAFLWPDQESVADFTLWKGWRLIRICGFMLWRDSTIGPINVQPENPRCRPAVTGSIQRTNSLTAPHGPDERRPMKRLLILALGASASLVGMARADGDGPASSPALASQPTVLPADKADCAAPSPLLQPGISLLGQRRLLALVDEGRLIAAAGYHQPRGHSAIDGGSSRIRHDRALRRF